MDSHYETVRELIRHVRARWRALSLFHAAARGALAAAAVLLVALAVARWVDRVPTVLAAIGFIAGVLAVAAIVRAAAPLRRAPSDLRVARFVEEREPTLDDRLVTAVDLIGSDGQTRSPAIAEPMLADAAARARAVDVDAIVASATLRRAGFRALAAAMLLAVVMVVARGPARQSYDAAALVLFPEHVGLDVTPGNARVKSGSALTIAASLVGNHAPVTPVVHVLGMDGDTWRQAAMAKDRTGQYVLSLDSVTAPFKYRVAAGPITSPTYAVAVVHAPRVARIDVEYTYPAGLGLAPRTEQDSGDIYAPAGTDVRLRIHADRAAASGRLTLGDGTSRTLSSDAEDSLSTTLKVVDDTSYRIALADADGLSSAGDTEYFIRMLEDR